MCRTNVARLHADLRDAAEDHVVDEGRVEASGDALKDQGVDHRSAEVRGVQVADATTVLARRRPGTSNDEGAVGHFVILIPTRSEKIRVFKS